MMEYIVIEVDPRFQSIGSHGSCCFSTSYAPVKTGTLLGFSHSGQSRFLGENFRIYFIFLSAYTCICGSSSNCRHRWPFCIRKVKAENQLGRKSFLATESDESCEPDIDRDRDRHKQIHSVAL